MNYEKEIKDLRKQLNNLQDAFLTSIKNNTSVVDKVDTTANQVVSITPFTESKKVGIQDTECIFTDVDKEGSLTTTVKTESGEYLPFTVERSRNRIRVSFDSLNEVATVTISIQ